MRRHLIHLLSVLAAFAILEVSAGAGQTADMGTSPGQQLANRLEARVQQLNEALNLTEEQKARITPWIADEIKQLEQVRADTSLAPADKLAKTKEIRQATHRQIRALLTAEQQQTLDTMWQRGQAARSPDRQGQGAQGRLQQLAARLNLTDDQKAKIAPILQDEFQQMQQVRADTSLTRRERFAKLREIQQNANKQIQPLLTPEQQKQLDEIRQEARERRAGRRGRGRPLVY